MVRPAAREASVSLVPPRDPDAGVRAASRALMVATASMVFFVRLVQWESAGNPFVDALAFTVVLGAILGAHEAGHVWCAQRYGFRLGPPIFLPLPIWVGTLGALIQVKELPPSRRALLAMGAGGPLAGFTVIMVAVLLKDAAPGETPLSAPLVFHLGSMMSGSGAAVATTDPVGFAAWVGCLVTSLNLLPVGQLDGGHVFSALWPGREWQATWLTGAALCVLGVLWWPWLVWAAVVLLGLRAPLAVRNGAEEPSQAERRLALGCGLVWVMCFTPLPLAV